VDTGSPRSSLFNPILIAISKQEAMLTNLRLNESSIKALTFPPIVGLHSRTKEVNEYQGEGSLRVLRKIF